MNVERFVRDLASVQLPNVFNPYRDTCALHDQTKAAALRRQNLALMLQSLLDLGSDTVWMGRDLGYRGGRRTGLALTDEAHLPWVARVYPGASAVRATSGDAVAERTAAEIWGALPQLDVPPLLWNVFPFHPHQGGDGMSNRKFSISELAQAEEINAQLFRSLGIRRAISIGQDAASYAVRLGLKVSTVRHPSYGGTSDFRAGIAAIYGLRSVRPGAASTQSALF
jgi:hypothetical protein